MGDALVIVGVSALPTAIYLVAVRQYGPRRAFAWAIAGGVLYLGILMSCVLLMRPDGIAIGVLMGITLPAMVAFILIIRGDQAAKRP